MTDNVQALKLSALEQAKAELAKENSEKAVKLLKGKLREKQAAELVVSNLEREIADLNKRIEQGDVEA